MKAIVWLPLAFVQLLALTSVVFAKPWATANRYENGIPIGTKINASNWQQYQQFMDPGLLKVLKGTSFWHLPKGWEINVGPTWSDPLPRPYLQDTEQYGSQVKLQKTADGGYYPSGYVAGIPFPLPEKGGGDPLIIGAKVYWDTFYRFHARLEDALDCTYTVDQYGNYTETGQEDTVTSDLTHLSDPPYPRTLPNNGGYYYASYFSAIAPEQVKYFTILTIFLDDPEKITEEYEYVPSLRRSLRLSQAARCAPIFGTDSDVEDGFVYPLAGQLFRIEYLGVKKVLAPVHLIHESLDSCGTSTTPPPKYFYVGGKGILPLPTPAAGPWEVRDTYLISMTRLPPFATGYCYGKRLLYVDKQSFQSIIADMYDSAGKLWKYLPLEVTPIELHGGSYFGLGGYDSTSIANFLDLHATYLAGTTLHVDSEVDPGYLDATRYALPQGLMKIGQ